MVGQVARITSPNTVTLTATTNAIRPSRDGDDNAHAPGAHISMLPGKPYTLMQHRALVGLTNP
jgi:hypothetical protein